MNVGDIVTDLITQAAELPANLDDLAKFVLIGNDKLQAVRAEISAIKKLGLAKEVHEQKLKEAQDISEIVTLAKMKMGELLNKLPKNSGGDRKSDNFKFGTPAEYCDLSRFDGQKINVTIRTYPL